MTPIEVEEIVIKTLARLLAGHEKDKEIAALKEQLREVEKYHDDTERARMKLQLELAAIRAVK